MDTTTSGTPTRIPYPSVASIGDADIATAVLDDRNDSLMLVSDGLTGGETTVTLTATDPDGAEAQVSGRIMVVEPVLFWRDDFDYDNGGWSFGYGAYRSYVHRRGRLRWGQQICLLCLAQ